MAYVVTVDFGAGPVDISAYLHEERKGQQYPVRRSRRLHNNLRPVIGTCSFFLAKRDNAAVDWASLLGDFMTATTDPEVVVTSGGSGYFKGVVRRTVKVKVGLLTVDALRVECVDSLYRLRSRAAATAVWKDYTVSNPANKSASILHQLFYAAGFEDAELSFGTIAMSVDRYAVEEGSRKTYRVLIEEVLRDVTYTVHVEGGIVYTYDLAPNSITTTGTLSTGASGNIAEGYQVDRREEHAEAVDVHYNTHETLEDEIVFDDSTGATAALDCSISVPAATYYPEGASDGASVLARYDVDKRKLIAVDNAAIDWLGTVGVAKQDETPASDGMWMRFYSDSGGTITRLKVHGDALVVKDECKVVKENVSSTDLREVIESKLITLKLWAERCAGGRAAWHDNGVYEYVFPRVLAGAWIIGQYVELSDTTLLGVEQTLRIIGIDDGGDPLTVHLICEGVGPYTYAELDETVYRRSLPLPATSAMELNKGSLVLSVEAKKQAIKDFALLYSWTDDPTSVEF